MNLRDWMCEAMAKDGKADIYVVGLGPGNVGEMTPRALQALRDSDVIVGYTLYVQLIETVVKDKMVLSTPMKGEVDRCASAVEQALKGLTVSVVSSGDAGVYGMAGLVYQLAAAHPHLEIEVIPGVTAATASAAVLGAPLGHDFAVVSLSDLLTDWSVIEKRLRAAAQADFILCLYNPSSKKRKDYLERACRILMEFKSPGTACGVVRNAGRNGETHTVLTLEELCVYPVDMFATVIVGNSQTAIVGGKLVTPRGYAV